MERLRAAWLEKEKDILSGAPPQLPPMRDINHAIPLIDEKRVYSYYLPKCADSMKPLLLDKINRYVENEWWEFATAPQAMPLMCLAKKDGSLRTVFDCRQRNDNTIRDVSPFPDQEQIRMDLARAPFRSKIDLSDAYEQIRIVPEDVWKTAFVCVYGTMISKVMQQGDCNAPSTFQRLMTHIFRAHIGRFVHVYLDDIFIFSYSLEEHERHLGIVFQILRQAKLYLRSHKLDLYSDRLDCLGHIIDDKGLHADADKMARIREWRVPRDLGDVQRFLGLVQYLANFMPDVSAYTGPLSAITRNGHSFEWRPVHQKCFESIKALACKVPILKPIDASLDVPIWVVCDASVHGVGALYGQGPEWSSCRPAGFMSRKFTSAQRAYRVFELETLAILEALLKWEDKLLGLKFCVVTDHQALEFFKTQHKLSPRQSRWMEYIERFDYRIQYVKGEVNKVADCLSRRYATDNEEDHYTYDEYVRADVRLDPEGESLPIDRMAEVRAMRLRSADRPLVDKTENEERRLEAEVLSAAQGDVDASTQPMIPEDAAFPLKERISAIDRFYDTVKDGYAMDPLFKKIINAPNEHSSFELTDGLLWRQNLIDKKVLCIPRVKLGKRALVAIIIDHAHTAIGHFGP